MVNCAAVERRTYSSLSFVECSCGSETLNFSAIQDNVCAVLASELFVAFSFSHDFFVGVFPHSVVGNIGLPCSDTDSPSASRENQPMAGGGIKFSENPVEM